MEKSRAVLIESSSSASSLEIEQALNAVLTASRDAAQRPAIASDNRLFQALLDQLRLSCQDGVERQHSRIVKVLSCLGNLVADNETNRSAFLARNGALESMTGILYGRNTLPESLAEASVAVKVLYNLCNDYGRQGCSHPSRSSS